MLLPMARELGKHKIRVMNIAPGTIRTPMTEAGLPPPVMDLVLGFTLTRTLGEPEHFAQLVEAIITNGFLNGTSIHLDDGMVIPHV